MSDLRLAPWPTYALRLAGFGLLTPDDPLPLLYQLVTLKGDNSVSLLPSIEQ
jgi:hypothetical protein